MIYVSIIIPVYNLQGYLEECLESVLHQTYKSLQIILVDDGSTDSSLNICNCYAGKDCRILVEHQDNQGVSAARNLGLKKATGEYVFFIDGDDTIAPNYIESYLDKAKETCADIVIGGFTKTEQEHTNTVTPKPGIYNTKDFFSLLCKEGTQIYGYVWCKLFRFQLIKENAIFFNEKMNSQEDLDFMLSVYGKARKICCFDHCGYFYEYASNTRKALPESVLGNQVKLFNLATDADADTNSMHSRFQSMLYTWLYHAKSVQDINTIINMNIPIELLDDLGSQRWEVKTIIRYFKKKDARFIFRYFFCRRVFRNFLVKVHLAEAIK